jgi:predicted DNA-binding protein (MmcQ/YjbR family)
MNIDWVRELCLSYPGATEQTVWEGDLTFKVGGKMFAHTVLELAPVWLSFKCSPENFAELTERAGIIPAPYLARAQWVALETKEALAPGELSGLLRASYDLVVAKLPKKTRETFSQASAPKREAVKQEASARVRTPNKAREKRKSTRTRR